MWMILKNATTTLSPRLKFKPAVSSSVVLSNSGRCSAPAPPFCPTRLAQLDIRHYRGGIACIGHHRLTRLPTIFYPCSAVCATKMTTNIQQGSLLDVLKKKMRQTKEEMERYKDECEETIKKLQLETMRREEAESEVAALNRRIQLLEEDLERSEERLATATAKLAEASAAADESERIRKALENRTNMEDDRVSILEQQLAQAKLIAEEADKKYEEVARKLVLMEQDLERAEERAEISDSKIVELEEELRVVGNNLKSLEVSEEKATRKEDEYSITLKQVEQQLREAEARAEFAERSVQKLQKEVDRLEDDLLTEKEKNKMLADEMEATLHDIQNM